MELSRNTLSQILSQKALDQELRKALAWSFELGGEAWPWLEGLELPKLPKKLPPTYDPVLLALRRLVLRNFGELRAMHRMAVLQAKTRPFGFLHLALEEVAQLERSGAPPPLEHDSLFVIYFELLPTTAPLPLEKLLYDLRARSYAEGARRQIATGDKAYPLILSFALSMAGSGTGDLELEAFLLETVGLSLGREDRNNDEVFQRAGAVKRLAGYPVPDRTAEAMVDLAEALRARGPRPHSPFWLYEAAAEKLALLDPDLNLKLRRRVALALRGR